MKIRIILLVLLTFGITACGKKEPSPTDPAVLQRLATLEKRLDAMEGRWKTMETPNALNLAELAKEELLQVSSNMLTLQNRVGQLEAQYTTLLRTAPSQTQTTPQLVVLENRLEAATADLQQKVQALEAAQTAPRDGDILQRLAVLETKNLVVVTNTTPPARTETAAEMLRLKWLYSR